MQKLIINFALLSCAAFGQPSSPAQGTADEIQLGDGTETRVARSRLFNILGHRLRLTDLKPGEQQNIMMRATISERKELPVSDVDTVIVGNVVDVKVYLSQNGRNLYTEYTVKVEKVINSPIEIAPRGEVAFVQIGATAKVPTGGVIHYDLPDDPPAMKVGERALIFAEYVQPPVNAFSMMKRWKIESGLMRPANRDDVNRVYQGTSIVSGRTVEEVVGMIGTVKNAK